MKKIKVKIGYQYLGDSIGSLPFIDFIYLTEDGRELDALSALNERHLSCVVPHTRFFSGIAADGQKFVVERYGDIPKDAVYPIFEKAPDFYDIDDYMSSDVEMIAKKLAGESCGSALRYSFCDFKYGSYHCADTKNLDDPQLKNALISDIKLDYDKMVDLDLSLEEKSLFIAESFIRMFDVVKNSADYDISNFDFEIEGMKFDLLNSCDNIEKVVQTIIVNGSKKRFARVSESLNSQVHNLPKDEYDNVSVNDAKMKGFDGDLMDDANVYDDVSMSGAKISGFDDDLMVVSPENDHKIKVTLKKDEYFTYGNKYFVVFEYGDKEAQDRMYKVFQEQLIPGYGSHSYRNGGDYEGDYIMPYLVDENGEFSVQDTNIIGGTNIPEDLLPSFIERFVEVDGAVVKIGDEEMKDYFYRDRFDEMLSAIDSKKSK